MDVIEINKKQIEKKKEIQVVEDVIVPDVKPDIVSIIDTNSVSYAYKVEKIDGKIKIDGNLDCYIVYVSSDGDTRGIQSTFNFSDTIESSEIKESMILKYKIDVTKVETKILNERKLNVINNLNISYELYEKQKLEISNEFENIECLQVQSKDVNLNSVVGINVGKAQVKEDLKVDNMDNIAEILKVDIVVKNKETKISYNKILAKAEAEISVMYLTEDNRISKFQSDFPIMSFIDLENVKEDNTCDIDYQIRNVFLKPNSSEEHSISCQIDFELICEAYETRQMKIVSDLYSLKSDIEFSTKEVEADLSLKNNENIVDITEKIEVQEIKRVLDIDVNGKVLKNVISTENSNLEGEIELKIYYELTSKMGLNVKTVTVPFITKTPLIQDPIDVNIIKKEFDSEENNVIVNLSLNIFSRVSQKQSINIVENVNVKDIVNADDYSVVLYFVKPGDTLWNIAKKFRVTVDSLVKVNDIENPDMIHIGDKLYVVK
ncbi:MAG: DUF3794 domain-containing protein [Clostridia bacterium]|nr:DUF3794 domain-containing protein [Clostridia bacterium]